ncbi:hypothetical protein GCM10009760_30780 [Kitasatospora kazusensis]|uniref:Uncharacterized protein n=1 Tax=Kitasatospora kazusensis TaxID=407974 RepID=A0ABN2ZL95_9ACTN
MPLLSIFSARNGIDPTRILDNYFRREPLLHYLHPTLSRAPTPSREALAATPPARVTPVPAPACPGVAGDRRRKESAS